MKIIPKIEFLEHLGGGAKADVFRISPIHATKFIQPSEPNHVERLTHEFQINKQLAEAGISVARPFGVFNLKHSRDNDPYGKDRTFSWGFVMEYLDGIILSQAILKSQGLVKKFHDELEKAKRAGFTPGYDAYDLKQGIWSHKKERLYLIDFETWRHR